MTTWLVVGGGAAGCVVAARLSEVESNEVAVLEAGPDHGTSVGAPGAPVLDRPELLMPAPAVVRIPGAPAEPYAQGFGLGGSSLVNGAVVVGEPADWASGHDLPIERVTDPGPVALALLDIASDAAPVSLIARNGKRVSAADAYLRPMLERPNLSALTNTPVDRVVFDGEHAVGVETAAGDHLAADRIVLCAGAIGTPTILLRSGLDTPGLGDGLQDHVGFAISFELLSPAPSDVVAIGATIERPGRQVVVMDQLPGRDDLGAMIAGHLAVASTGRVTLPDLAGPPIVELGQLTVPSDLDGLMLIARETLELLVTPRMREVIGEAYVDDHGTTADTLRDDVSLRSWLPSHLGGYHHLAGSCRLGVCLALDGSVSDRVGVYVADAAALPGVPSMNPYLAVVRLAERLARGWCEENQG